MEKKLIINKKKKRIGGSLIHFNNIVTYFLEKTDYPDLLNLPKHIIDIESYIEDDQEDSYSFIFPLRGKFFHILKANLKNKSYF